MKTRTPLAIILLALSVFFLNDGAAQNRATSSQTLSAERLQVKFTDAYNVRAFGAKGDSKTVDTPAINRAIETAAGAGGGTVRFPAGTYLCFTIHLRSHVALSLDQGATILAADAKQVRGSYDLPEQNQWDMYQDFGHSHWQNSLIAGIELEDISISGPGMIDGRGLTRRSPRPRRSQGAGDAPVSLGGER